MIAKTYFKLNGYELSEMNCFSSSSKRFINKHKEDIEIFKFKSEPLKVFYGESCGEFRYDCKTEKHKHIYGNLYKAEIITKIVNELMQRGFVGVYN